MRWLTLFLIALAASSPARAAEAAWREATSRHFIVYSEGDEESLRKAVTDLEKYDFLLRFVTSTKSSAPPLKLKIYLVRDMEAVADTLPFGGWGVGGYYEGTARGPYAVSFRKGGTTGFDAQDVLFHEYAHHFMLQNFPATYPSWYIEGFAEYYGATKLLENNVISVGHGQRARYTQMRNSTWLPLRKVLTARSYSDVGDQIGALYSQGWMLVHYFANNKERRGQLQNYLNSINAGKSYEEAMNTAFGPGAEELNKELRAYVNSGRVNTLQLPFKSIDVGEIRLRDLSTAEAALLEHDIALSSGVPANRIGRFVSEVRSITKRHPHDPSALAILVEAERLAGNWTEASAAVERWLAEVPGSPRALMHKGELEAEALKKAGSTNKAAWAAARTHILSAHKAAPKDPLILIAYYNSFVAEGVLPPPGAQNGLVRAFELVPQDEDLRYLLAADFEKRAMIKEAAAVIRPAAFALHAPDDESDFKKKKRARMERKYRLAGEEKRETAREMLMRLEKQQTATTP
jgi:hypothetical protein